MGIGIARCIKLELRAVCSKFQNEYGLLVQLLGQLPPKVGLVDGELVFSSLCASLVGSNALVPDIRPLGCALFDCCLVHTDLPDGFNERCNGQSRCACHGDVCPVAADGNMRMKWILADGDDAGIV